MGTVAHVAFLTSTPRFKGLPPVLSQVNELQGGKILALISEPEMFVFMTPILLSVF